MVLCEKKPRQRGRFRGARLGTWGLLADCGAIGWLARRVYRFNAAFGVDQSNSSRCPSLGAQIGALVRNRARQPPLGDSMSRSQLGGCERLMAHCSMRFHTIVDVYTRPFGSVRLAVAVKDLPSSATVKRVLPVTSSPRRSLRSNVLSSFQTLDCAS